MQRIRHGVVCIRRKTGVPFDIVIDSRQMFPQAQAPMPIPPTLQVQQNKVCLTANHLHIHTHGSSQNPKPKPSNLRHLHSQQLLHQHP